jgi:hypothetical protein
MKRNDHAKDTGGGSPPISAGAQEGSRRSAGEIFSKKASSDLEPSLPDIAHPNDSEKWETQTALVTDWLFEMLDRIECDDETAAREARAELQTFFLNIGGQLLRVALSKKDSHAKKRKNGRQKKQSDSATHWAGRVLADIFVSVGKHVGKVRVKEPYGELMDNPAFKNEKKKIGKVRTDVLFPAHVCAITQRELKIAARHCRMLRLLKTGCRSEREQKRREELAKEHGFELTEQERGTTWKQAAERQKIPQEYWPLVNFPEFSTNSLDEWFTFLWPLISKKINVAKLESRYKLARMRLPKDSHKTAYDHLKTLARLRDQGAFNPF